MWIEDNEKGILYPHEDTLIKKAKVTNREFSRIFMASRSSANTIFKSTLNEMGIEDVRLEHTNTLLNGFRGGD